MKRVLSVVSLFLLALFLIACEKTDEQPTDKNQVALDSAYSKMGAIISDPSNITVNFVVPTTLAGGVKAEWSSKEEGVISFVANPDGTMTATVNRPNMGEGDAKVEISAKLTIKAELSDATLEKVWSIVLTVKENTVEVIEINTIADVLAIRDEAYDGGTYSVTIPNVTVFAKGDVFFGYDGTGIVQLYQSQTTYEIGKVYTITGALEWYFGIWEIVKSTGVEQTGATPQYPTKQEIESVEDVINEFTEAGHHDYPTVASGNFEPVYATITGKVYMIPNDSSNYNTYIIDKDAETLVLGTSTQPANGLLVYYNTSDLAYLRSFAGFEVTMDVIIYTYRSNNLAFAIYYVGGPTGITANLNNEQKVDLAKSATKLPVEVYKANTTLTLPTTVEGVNVAWSFANQDAASNALVNLTTGAVTLPEGARQEVKLKATYTLGDAAGTKEFSILVGEIPLSTAAEVKAATSNTYKFRVQGTVLGYNGNRQISIVDASGAVTVYETAANAELINALNGKVVEFIGSRTVFNDLVQLTNVEFKEVADATPIVPTAADLLTYAKWDAKTLMPLQSGVVSVANLKVTEIVANTFGNVELVLVDVVTERTIKFFWDSRQPLAKEVSDFLLAVKVGDWLSFNSALLTWRNSTPQLAVTKVGQVVAGTEVVLTEAQKLNLDKLSLVVPSDIRTDLPSTFKYGSTVVWTASEAGIIAADGKFTAPATSKEVTLTAVLTNGEETVTLTFTVVARSADDKESLLFTFTFGDVAKTGYSAGTIKYNEGEQEISIEKNRAQINANASNDPWKTSGQFLVFAPIGSAKESYAILDLTADAFKDMTKIEFSFAAWNQNNVAQTKALEDSYLGIEKLVDGEWVKVGANVFSQLTKDELVTVSFDVQGGGKYRIVYNAPSATKTGNTDYAIGVDNVKILG
ncbi:immunoglobulin-like domain-containing protein [Acholeplasma hippikon]|uniref:Atrophied bacterial Ig domain-containing protein n=1 Tax=Acholeplasma hippikon TaxID=264636 RepID=A0A449BL37_9MOLU|nr:immunoglobulin-like domain-containing protein [Acholeplasma hippikon]VEU83047.1 Uncharacterised protein [Acholeplasma hippikon]